MLLSHISFGPFVVNIFLALLSLFFKNIGQSILRQKPLKYLLPLGVALILASLTISTQVFHAYNQLVTYTSILITVLESALIIKVVFSFSHYFKNKIDFTGDILQLPCFAILAASTILLLILIQNLYEVISPRTNFLLTIQLIVCCVLILVLAFSRKYVQCIISNGLGVSAYLAVTNAWAFRQTAKYPQSSQEIDPTI